MASGSTTPIPIPRKAPTRPPRRPTEDTYALPKTRRRRGLLVRRAAGRLFRDSPDTVAQAVKTRLMLLRGEWFLDSTEGMPWQGEVLGKQPRASYDWAIRQRMLGTPGVTGISDYASRLDPQSRGLSVTATLTTLYGGHRAGGSMTILSTAPVIDAAGIRAPSYGEVLQYFKDQYRNIYGADTYLEADSQDGQLLAVFAMAIHDANTAAVQVYNAFSPATARAPRCPATSRSTAWRAAWPRARRSICASWGRAAPPSPAAWRWTAIACSGSCRPASPSRRPADYGHRAVPQGRRRGRRAGLHHAHRHAHAGLAVRDQPGRRHIRRPSKATRRCGSGKPCRWRCRRAPCWKARSVRWRPCRACCGTSPTRTTRPSRMPMACRRTASRWWWTAATQA